MARTVEDLAFFLDAMSGDDPRDPMSKPRPIRSFLNAARGKTQPLRVAYSEDLGITPVDREVRRITREAAEQFRRRVHALTMHIPMLGMPMLFFKHCARKATPSACVI